MVIPPSVDGFLTSSYLYQTIKILFVNMKKIVKVIFSADRVAPRIRKELGKNIERVRWKNLRFIL